MIDVEPNKLRNIFEKKNISIEKLNFIFERNKLIIVDNIQTIFAKIIGIL